MILSSQGVTLKVCHLLNFSSQSVSHKGLRTLKYLLGIEIMRSKQESLLSQWRYVLDLLSEIGKLGVKPCNTPMAPNMQFTKGGLFEDYERYRRLVRKLNYLTVSRPNIAYSVSVVSQYMSFPTNNHWAAIEVLCYLKGALRHGILYKNHEHTRIECFSDVD